MLVTSYLSKFSAYILFFITKLVMKQKIACFTKQMCSNNSEMFKHKAGVNILHKLRNVITQVGWER